MAKAIELHRASNQSAAKIADEVIEEARETIQDALTNGEKNSSWLTLTMEFQVEAGKLRTIRSVINKTRKATEPSAQNGEVLTRKPVGA